MCLNALARYLLAVYQLSADGAAVRSVEIANALGVSRASVVKSLKKLAEGGFVQKEYYGSVHLTPQGLREAGRLEALTPKLREAAQLREAHPELSLAQLAALCDPPVTKSSLSHRLRKLIQLSQEGEERPLAGPGAGIGRWSRQDRRRLNPATWSPAPIRGGDPGFLYENAGPLARLAEARAGRAALTGAWRPRQGGVAGLAGRARRAEADTRYGVRERRPVYLLWFWLRESHARG